LKRFFALFVINLFCHCILIQNATFKEKNIRPLHRILLIDSNCDLNPKWVLADFETDNEFSIQMKMNADNAGR